MLLVVKRLPIARGYSFEIEERGAASLAISEGDLPDVSKVRVAAQHHSTAMALLAMEDTVPGVIDASFMQFYLSIEATLATYKKTN
jgi:hypothetical protein